MIRDYVTFFLGKLRLNTAIMGLTLCFCMRPWQTFIYFGPARYNYSASDAFTWWTREKNGGEWFWVWEWVESLIYLMRYWDHVSCGDFLSLYRILSGKIITFSLAVMCARLTMMIDEKNLRRCYQVFPQYLPRRDILYRWQLLHSNVSMWVNEIFWRQQRLKIRWYLGRATNITNDRILKKRNLIFITHGSLAMMRRLEIMLSEEGKSRHRLGKKKISWKIFSRTSYEFSMRPRREITLSSSILIRYDPSALENAKQKVSSTYPTNVSMFSKIHSHL